MKDRQKRTDQKSPVRQRAAIGFPSAPLFSSHENKPVQLQNSTGESIKSFSAVNAIQRKIGFEFETGGVATQQYGVFKGWHNHPKGYVLAEHQGYKITTDEGANQSQLEMILTEFDETDQNELTNFQNQTLPAAQNALDNIIADAYDVNGPVLARDIRGLSGTWHRLSSNSNDSQQIAGQLQMTGGFSLSDMAAFMSGLKRRNMLQQNLGLQQPDPNAAYLTSAYSGDTLGVEWRYALTQVNNQFAGVLNKTARRQLASVVALLAAVPVNSRTINPQYPKMTSPHFMARTDFATIMMQLPDLVKARLTPAIMTQMVVATVNADPNLPAPVNANDFVFSNNFPNNVPRMDNSLTITDWISSITPNRSDFWSLIKGQDVYNSGKDKLTKKNFPGTKQQKSYLESMGSFGSKMDPGDKPIFEVRGLRGSMASDMAAAVNTMILYKEA